MPALQVDGCKLPNLYWLSYKRSSFYWQAGLARNYFWHLKLDLLTERESSPQLQKPRISWCKLLPAVVLETGCPSFPLDVSVHLRKVHLWHPRKLPFVLCHFLFLEDGRGKREYQRILKRKKNVPAPQNPMWNLQVQASPENETCWGLRAFATQSCNALHLDKRLCLELEIETIATENNWVQAQMGQIRTTKRLRIQQPLLKIWEQQQGAEHTPCTRHQRGGHTTRAPPLAPRLDSQA